PCPRTTAADTLRTKTAQRGMPGRFRYPPGNRCDDHGKPSQIEDGRRSSAPRRPRPLCSRTPRFRTGRPVHLCTELEMLEELKAKLEQEIERLTHELQVTLPRAIKTAVEHGDLRENSEYKSALERQQFVQARLNHLTRRAQELSKIDLTEIPNDRVGFGSRVTVKDKRTKEEEEYTLVFGDYIDID